MPSRKANYTDRLKHNRECTNDRKREKKWVQGVQGDGGWLSLLLYSPLGNDILRILSFRWLNIQIAPLPKAPQSPPSFRIWLRLLRMRSCCSLQDRPHSLVLSPDALSCLWCARNMRDGGLSATCQLGNYCALVPGATEPAKPAWLPSTQKLCCWWNWLIPRNAGLSSCSSVNDFIQQGEVTRGLVIKALHFTVKTACLCAVLTKKREREKDKALQERRGGKKEDNIQVSLAPKKQSLS